MWQKACQGNALDLSIIVSFLTLRNVIFKPMHLFWFHTFER